MTANTWTAKRSNGVWKETGVQKQRHLCGMLCNRTAKKTHGVFCSVAKKPASLVRYTTRSLACPIGIARLTSLVLNSTQRNWTTPEQRVYAGFKLKHFAVFHYRRLKLLSYVLLKMTVSVRPWSSRKQPNYFCRLAHYDLCLITVNGISNAWKHTSFFFTKSWCSTNNNQNSILSYFWNYRWKEHTFKWSSMQPARAWMKNISSNITLKYPDTLGTQEVGTGLWMYS